MKLSKILILFFAWLLIANDTFPQGQLDNKSLRKADSLYEVGDELLNNGHFDQAIIVFKEIRLIADYLPDQELNSSATNDIGYTFKRKGLYDSALIYYQQAYEIDSVRGDLRSAMGKKLNIAIVHKNQGNYSSASKLFFNGLAKALEMKDTIFIAKFSNSLGSISKSQGRYDEAKDYYLQALKYFKLKKRKADIAIIYNNLGNVYEGSTVYDSAVYYYQEALNLKRKNDSKSLGSTFNNLASVFLELDQLDSSFYFLQKASLTRRKLGDQKGTAITSLTLARYLIEENQLQNVKELLDSTIHYALAQRDRQLLQDCYQQSTLFYKQLNKMDLAFDYLQRFMQLKDSIFNEEKLKTLELQSKFELSIEKKEKELAIQNLALLNLTNKQQTNLIVFILVVLTLSFFSLWISLGHRKSVLENNKKVSDFNMKLQSLNDELLQKNEHIEILRGQNFHFTKNSFAEIAAMLKSKVRVTKNATEREILLAEKLRMETVGLLHRELFSLKSNAIDLANYLKNIIENTLDTMLNVDHEVKLKLQLEQVEVNNKIAFDLGIIVNEICLNACKYAFEGNEGELSVELFHQQDQLYLYIKDDGPGLPEGFDISKSDSFGMRMIHKMAASLRATFIVGIQSGLEYQIKIPLRN